VVTIHKVGIGGRAGEEKDATSSLNADRIDFIRKSQKKRRRREILLREGKKDCTRRLVSSSSTKNFLNKI